MLDLKLVRDDPEGVKAALAKRGPGAAGLVDRLLEADATRRRLVTEVDALRATQKRRGREVARAAPDQRQQVLTGLKELSDRLAEAEASLRAAEAELAELPQVEIKAKAPRDLSGAGRILFVEDEAAVRGIAARLLRQRGYDVIEAADGEEALALAEEHAGTIDMMISDVIMPGLDGPALLKKARPYLGDAPVLFISGYAESDFSDLLQDEVGVSFLPKPLDIKTLAERVKQELHTV